jgi:hypothetical protein
LERRSLNNRIALLSPLEEVSVRKFMDRQILSGLVEAVVVELSHKRLEFAVVEVFGNEFAGKSWLILDEDCSSLIGPVDEIVVVRVLGSIVGTLIIYQIVQTNAGISLFLFVEFIFINF